MKEHLTHYDLDKDCNEALASGYAPMSVRTAQGRVADPNEDYDEILSAHYAELTALQSYIDAWNQDGNADAAELAIWMIQRLADQL